MRIASISVPDGFFSTLAACLWIPLLPAKERSAALKKYAIRIDASFVISASIQLVAFLYFSIHGLIEYQETVLDPLYKEAIKTGDDRVTIGFFMQMGLVNLIGFFFTARGFFFALGFGDSAVRLVGYGVLKEPLGSIFCLVPIRIFEFLLVQWNRIAERLQFGPETADEVQMQAKENQIIILSARKKDWNPAMTIRYKNQDYHPEPPVRVQHGSQFRYSYRLVPQHEHEIIRRLIVYQT